MDPLTACVLVLAALAGGTSAGLVGWGGWIVFGSLTWLLLDPYTAFVAGFPATIGIDLVLVVGGRRNVDLRAAGRLAAWLALGLLAGTALLTQLSRPPLQACAGMLILLALSSRVWQAMSGRRALGGVLCGVFTMVGGFNGPPLALALDDLALPARRATLGLLFLALSGVGVLLAWMAGVPGEALRHGVAWGALLVGPATAGTLLGVRLSHRGVAAAWVGPLTKTLCALAGAGLLVRALLAG